MSALRFAFTFLSCLLLAGQLSFPLAQTDAAEKKPEKHSTKPKVQMAKPADGVRECCAPGFPCPAPQTDDTPGCKCCAFRIDGRLVQYNGLKKNSTLDLDGNPIVFVVTDERVDKKLKDIGNGNNGQFIVKQKLFENGDSPTGNGSRLECIDTGDTTYPNQNVAYLKGTDVSGKVYEVIEALFNAIPRTPPVYEEDKREP